MLYGDIIERITVFLGEFMQHWISYLIFGIAAATIGLALLAGWWLAKRKRKNGPVWVKAALIKTQKEREQFQTPDGAAHTRTIRMTLTFQTIHNELLTFEVDERYQGKIKEKQWGDLRYQNDRLVKFVCPHGTIQRRFFG